MEHQEITKAFARNLREARKAAGLTQLQLAQQMGYSAKAVSKWESGECIAPAVLLPTLAQCLKTDVNALLRTLEEGSYYVGIDGGGTKTEFLLAKEGGSVLQRVVLPGCNPNDVGLSRCQEILKQGIQILCKDLPAHQISVFAGLAGGTTGDHRQRLLQFLSTFGFRSWDCGSDAANAMKATLGDRNGILIIAGTGNVTFVQKAGEKHKLGGFNYLFEEGGSAYMVGREALYYALKSEEKGRPDSLLYRLVLERCDTSTVLDYLGVLYAQGKVTIASFAPLVFDAARGGDGVAREILAKNAAVLAGEIEEGAALLGEFSPEVVLIGGMTRQSDLLLPLIQQYLHIECRLRVHQGSLAKGALMLAGWEETDAEN